MVRCCRIAVSLLTALAFYPAVLSSPITAHRPYHVPFTCPSLNQRRSWTSLTPAEKAAYIRAEQCLISAPPRAHIPGALTLWDELAWAHIVQCNVIHNVGAFLPWHRYHIRAHEILLQTACGYTGGQPYWDVQAEADQPLAQASVWGVGGDSFGGDGRPGDGCVVDGPFAGTMMRMSLDRQGRQNFTEYCLSRTFERPEGEHWGWARQEHADECLRKGDYEAAYECLNIKPHVSAHVACGGTIKDKAASPGDPIFWLHHANLDRLWWQWQQADPPRRLAEMGGRNVPTRENLEEDGLVYPSAAYTEYFGDGGGNVTSLNHTLWMVDLFPNVTVGDVMDLHGDVNCAEYV